MHLPFGRVLVEAAAPQKRKNEGKKSRKRKTFHSDVSSSKRQRRSIFSFSSGGTKLLTMRLSSFSCRSCSSKV
jgi:hypothetical protein